jgi:hypothetical protein
MGDDRQRQARAHPRRLLRREQVALEDGGVHRPPSRPARVASPGRSDRALIGFPATGAISFAGS